MEQFVLVVNALAQAHFKVEVVTKLQEIAETVTAHNDILVHPEI